MTEQTTSPDRSTRAGSSLPSPWAHGFVVFAGVMMILAGGFHAFAGLVGLFKNEFYVATRQYLLQSTPPAGAGSTS